MQTIFHDNINKVLRLQNNFFYDAFGAYELRDVKSLIAGELIELAWIEFLKENWRKKKLSTSMGASQVYLCQHMLGSEPYVW